MEFRGGGPAGLKWGNILDAAVAIIKYKKITIYCDIDIKVFSDVTLSYITVSTDNFLNTNNSETESPKLRKLLEEAFEIKFQEGYVIKYLNFRVFIVSFWFQC